MQPSNRCLPLFSARATADPAISVFPDAPFEIWPIEEFTYLDPTSGVNTTVGQRKAWVEQYRAKADPSYIDGECAESFLEFVARALSFLDRLATPDSLSVTLAWLGALLCSKAYPISMQGNGMPACMVIDQNTLSKRVGSLGLVWQGI